MIVGLIGGAGSGKSTVLNYLSTKYSANIIEADKIAKEVMKKGGEIYNQVFDAFPDAVEGDSISSTLLADIIFNDEEKLKQLNAITHPATIAEIEKQINNSINELTVVESAILIGSGIDKLCDELWFVYCEKEERIHRLYNTRGYSREKSLSIINSQMSDEDINIIADEFIDNSLSIGKTEEQIDLILQKNYC